MPAVFVVPAVFKAVDKMSAPMRRMQRSVKGFATSARMQLQRTSLAFSRFNQKVNRIGKNIRKSVGGIGLAFGALALIGVMGGMINVFADFEQANASLSAVMSSATKPQLKLLQDDALRLGAITAKTSTEIVGLQESFARLGFEAPAIKNMTQSTIAGSIAMKAELADTAELVGAVVKTFEAFSSVDAPVIIDQMTLATQKSALNFEKLQTSIPIVAGAAEAAGVPFTNLLAVLGKLSDSGIDASSSANALKRIFIESRAKGDTYQQVLARIVKNSDKLTASVDKFGVRAAVSSVILSKNLKQTVALDKALQNAGGTAETAANKQLNTLNGRLTILGSAWEGWILSVENGDGALSKSLKKIVEVATEFLSMATGTAKAEKNLSKTEKTIRKLAQRAFTFLKVLKWIVIAFVAFKAILFLINGILLIYNIAMGISAALNGAGAIAVGANAVALGAYNTVIALATAAQWLFNAALSLNPIGLVIIAIAALIAVVAVMVTKWNEWGAALSLSLGPLGMIISMVQSFRRNWDVIKNSFAEGGIVAGLKAIGNTIFDAILMPLQQLLKLIAKIPGMGDLVNPLVDKMQRFREGLGVNVTTNESGEAFGDGGSNTTNNIFSGNAPLLNNQNNDKQQDISSRIDLMINNRAGGTEVLTEGTGVNVESTGY